MQLSAQYFSGWRGKTALLIWCPREDRNSTSHQSQQAYHLQDLQRSGGLLSIMSGEQCIAGNWSEVWSQLATWIVFGHLNYVRQNLKLFLNMNPLLVYEILLCRLNPFFLKNKNLTPLQECVHLRAMPGFCGVLMPAIQNWKVSGGLRGKMNTWRL